MTLPPTSHGQEPDLSVVIPAYNEATRIRQTLEALTSFLAGTGRPFEIIVADDGSDDDTGEIVARQFPSVRLLRIRPNRGKGHAVRSGLQAATGSRILFTDADLSTPLEELDRLIAAIDDGADLAVASRALPGAQLDHRESAWRELAGKTFNLSLRALLHVPIRDTQCGFKLYRRAAADLLCRHQVIERWAFDAEHVWLAIRLGLVVREIPVRWSYAPDTKVRVLRDGLQMGMDVLRMRWHHRHLRPARVTESTPIAT
jgi:dolichyl-phosphate beta-glucosyltransferase